jgi:hypothetical protein
MPISNQTSLLGARQPSMSHEPDMTHRSSKAPTKTDFDVFFVKRTSNHGLTFPHQPMTLERSSQSPHHASNSIMAGNSQDAGVHKQYQPTDRPWGQDPAPACAELQHLATDSAPMDRWLLDSTRSQPWHSMEGFYNYSMGVNGQDGLNRA